MKGGIGLERVGALPGSTVRFFIDHYEVNGLQFKRERFMPHSGEFVVPANHWFIWPTFALSTIGLREDVVNTLDSTMMVDQKKFKGKAFQYWFFRKTGL